MKNCEQKVEEYRIYFNRLKDENQRSFDSINSELRMQLKSINKQLCEEREVNKEVQILKMEIASLKVKLHEESLKKSLMQDKAENFKQQKEFLKFEKDLIISAKKISESESIQKYLEITENYDLVLDFSTEHAQNIVDSFCNSQLPRFKSISMSNLHKYNNNKLLRFIRNSFPDQTQRLTIDFTKFVIDKQYVLGKF